MPAVSQAQRTAMAIAEHHPEKLKARNRGLLRMSQAQLHDFAATPASSLPKRAKRPERGKLIGLGSMRKQ